MSRLAAFLTVVVLAACDQSDVIGPPDPAPAAPAERPVAKSILAPGGWAGVRVGMSRARAIEAMGGIDSAPLPEKEVWEACYVLRPAGVPNVSVMIENSRVARIDVTRGARNVITDTGLEPGDAADQVRAAYGAQLEVEAQTDGPPGALFMTWWDRRNDHGIRFVVNDQGVVDTIIVGGPAIRYVEGCS